MISKHNKQRRTPYFLILFFLAIISLLIFEPNNAYAATGIDVNIVGLEPSGQTSLQILFLTVFIALLPSILVVMTTFTRLIIVFSFLRSALGTQQMPPNQVLIGLALMLTVFIMNPYIQRINENAFTPFSEGLITQEEAIDNAMGPIREFMLLQVTPNNAPHLRFFWEIAGQPELETFEDIPNYILIPAFILNELTMGTFLKSFDSQNISC